MKRLSIALSVGLTLLASPLLAQRPSPKTVKPEAAASSPSDSRPAARPVSPGDSLLTQPTISPGELKATPEMWFYEQNLRLYLDPKMAVRRAAEFDAEQRQRRLAAMKWFGFSNSRPRVSPDPIYGDYAPTWVSNHGHYPYRWIGVNGVWINVRSDTTVR